jgi:hypothetical protein
VAKVLDTDRIVHDYLEIEWDEVYSNLQHLVDLESQCRPSAATKNALEKMALIH